MPFQRKTLKEFPSFTPFIISAVSFFVIIIALFQPSPARAGFSLLEECIIKYNLEAHKSSILKGSNRGEEGVLMIRPEIARLYGFRALMDRNYTTAKRLFERTSELFKRVIEALTTHEEEGFPGEHVRNAGRLAVLYNKLFLSAQKHLADYRSELNEKNDDRLNKHLCCDLLKRLLEESLTISANNLRGGLATFYNRCHGLNDSKMPLNSRNIRFVNFVFNEFTSNASEKEMSLFDLDRSNKIDKADLDSRWKKLLGKSESRYIPFLESLLKQRVKDEYPVGSLLFLALIKQESNFNPNAVSHVGAVGLTQIMPKTAKNLGMENIYLPPYFDQAGSFMGLERKLRREAIGLISKINEENAAEYAKCARELMHNSFNYRHKRKKLFGRYKREVVSKGLLDDRLDPHKAINYGYQYFSAMMKRQKGDVSLALASYNAGPHRVKQYNGIPPYRETISFRNGVLKYYRNYLRRLNNDGLVKSYMMPCCGTVTENNLSYLKVHQQAEGG